MALEMSAISRAHLLAWLACTLLVTSPSGPIMHRVEVTTFSRRGSSGGLVTCIRHGHQI